MTSPLLLKSVPVSKKGVTALISDFWRTFPDEPVDHRLRGIHSGPPLPSRSLLLLYDNNTQAVIGASRRLLHRVNSKYEIQRLGHTLKITAMMTTLFGACETCSHSITFHLNYCTYQVNLNDDPSCVLYECIFKGSTVLPKLCHRLSSAISRHLCEAPTEFASRYSRQVFVKSSTPCIRLMPQIQIPSMAATYRTILQVHLINHLHLA